MPEKRAVICSTVLPEDDREAGSKRILDMVDLLLEAGWTVSYVSRLGDVSSPYVRSLRQRGVRTHVGFDDEADTLVVNGGFHLALLVFWETAERYLPLIRERSPQTRIVVDSVDLHFLRNGRSLLLRHAGVPARQLDPSFGAEFVREMNTYAAADAVLAVSRKEADFINDLNGSSTLARVVPLSEELPPSPYEFDERRGVLFVGNFRHTPNISAVRFLCEEVLPHLPPELTARHPVQIVGNELDRRVLAYGQGHPHVRMVGWVPSLLPYQHRARVAVLPLQWGAGTKRKGIQALAVGTPVVTTSVGAEGLDLADREHVLVADDPEQFALAIVRLLEDRRLWERLRANGLSHIVPRHSKEAVRLSLEEAVIGALARPAQVLAPRIAPDEPGMAVVRRVHERIIETAPEHSRVAIVSKGDPALVSVEGRHVQHFPANESGEYLGYHPRDSDAALALLGAAMDAGVDYLVLPQPSFWWLDHYSDFGDHLFRTYRVCNDDPDSSITFALREPAGAGRPVWMEAAPENSPAQAGGEAFTPEAAVTSTGRVVVRPELVEVGLPDDRRRRRRVLVVGAYLADKEHLADDAARELADTHDCEVDQRWIAVGEARASGFVAPLTTRRSRTLIPKFTLLESELEHCDIESYDYVLIVDDDVVFPAGFLDRFIRLQERYDLALAQPARTPWSYTNHPIVTQQVSSVVRQTRFVEIGPVFSVHRSAFDIVFPFDDSSPMGWGYENVWSLACEQRGLRLGIVDAAPVDHSIRKPVANYAWTDADAQRDSFFGRRPHTLTEECLRVLAVAPVSTTTLAGPGHREGSPLASVVIPTRDRAAWLERSLDSLTAQSVAADAFEVVVVDDGSSDATEQTVRRFAAGLDLSYIRIDPSGIAAAKNLGVLTSRAPITIFFDDDDVAGTRMVEEHIRAHTLHPAERIAVLGFTEWESSLDVTPLMRYVTGPGGFLFSYPRLVEGQLLDHTYFWGGRSSCKRSLLMGHGLFDQRFVFGCEDIELGFRLAGSAALKVVYWPQAKTYMGRPSTFEHFVSRCRRQGRSQYLFAAMHDDERIRDYCEVEGAEERWAHAAPLVGDIERRVAVLEHSGLLDAAALEELHALYRWRFEAAKAEGICEAMPVAPERGGEAPSPVKGPV